MIDKDKFRFRIGDTIIYRGEKHEVKAYYFSEGFNNYAGGYGYTIDTPFHDGSIYSYDECGNKMSFASASVCYIEEAYANALPNDTRSKRTLEVSLDQAIKWYNSGNSTLKNLALSAYSKEELEMSYQTIKSNIYTQSVCLEIPRSNREECALKAYSKLRLLAYAFNAGWTMRVGSVGYFIAKDECRSNSKLENLSFLSANYNHRIRNHNTVMQAGVVYFKNEKDAVKAYRILGEEEIEDLFR